MIQADSSLKLYSVAYTKELQSLTPKPFEPICNEIGDPKLLEYAHILHHLEIEGLGQLRSSDRYFVGYFSPRFFFKTGQSPSGIYDELLSKIKRSPNLDLVLVNPWWRVDFSTTHSIENGDVSHPGLMLLFRELCQAGVLPLSLQNIDYATFVNTTYSNYFVANHRFWAKWRSIVIDILEFTSNSSSVAGQLFRSSTSYTRQWDDRVDKAASNNVQLGIFLLERLPSVIIQSFSDLEVSYVCPFSFSLDPLLPVPKTQLTTANDLRLNSNQGLPQRDISIVNNSFRQLRSINTLINQGKHYEFIDTLTNDSLWPSEIIDYDRFTKLVNFAYLCNLNDLILQVYNFRRFSLVQEYIERASFPPIVYSLFKTGNIKRATTFANQMAEQFSTSIIVFLVRFNLLTFTDSQSSTISFLENHQDLIVSSDTTYLPILTWLDKQAGASSFSRNLQDQRATMNPLLLKSQIYL